VSSELCFQLFFVAPVHADGEHVCVQVPGIQEQVLQAELAVDGAVSEHDHHFPMSGVALCLPEAVIEPDGEVGSAPGGEAVADARQGVVQVSLFVIDDDVDVVVEAEQYEPGLRDGLQGLVEGAGDFLADAFFVARHAPGPIETQDEEGLDGGPPGSQDVFPDAGRLGIGFDFVESCRRKSDAGNAGFSPCE